MEDGYHSSTIVAALTSQMDWMSSKPALDKFSLYVSAALRNLKLMRNSRTDSAEEGEGGRFMKEGKLSCYEGEGGSFFCNLKSGWACVTEQRNLENLIWRATSF